MDMICNGHCSLIEYLRWCVYSKFHVDLLIIGYALIIYKNYDYIFVYWMVKVINVLFIKQRNYFIEMFTSFSYLNRIDFLGIFVE